MSDEVVDTSVNEDVQAESTVQGTDYEAVAREQGWRPKDEFTGDPSTFRDAKEFVERGELLNKIHELNRKEKEREEIVRQLFDRQNLLMKELLTEKEQKLKSAQTQAAELGDVESVSKITEDLIKVRSEQQQHVQVPHNQNQEPPEITEFKVRHHSWFNQEGTDNKAMTAFATALDVDLQTKNPHMPLKDRLRIVEEKVKASFPSRFSNAMQLTHSPVSGSVKTGSQKSSTRISDLPKELQDQAHYLKRVMGDAFNAESYIRDLKKTGLVK